MTEITVKIDTMADAVVEVTEYLSLDQRRKQAQPFVDGEATFELQQGVPAFFVVFLWGPPETKAPWSILHGERVLNKRPAAAIPKRKNHAISSAAVRVP